MLKYFMVFWINICPSVYHNCGTFHIYSTYILTKITVFLYKDYKPGSNYFCVCLLWICLVVPLGFTLPRTDAERERKSIGVQIHKSKFWIISLWCLKVQTEIFTFGKYGEIATFSTSSLHCIFLLPLLIVTYSTMQNVDWRERKAQLCKGWQTSLY